MRRPRIPANVERQLMIDAGWKCSIPMCGTNTNLEIDHIEEWSKIHEHNYANLLVLCPTHHAMKKSGSNPRQITAHSLRIVKQNQLEISGRYSDIERRVLEHFLRNPDERVIFLPGDFDILLMHLLDARILSKEFTGNGGVGIPFGEEGATPENMIILRQSYVLTEDGLSAVAALRELRTLR